MKNYIDTIKKALLFWLIAWISMLWVVYAANIISSVTTQTINTWDTISQSWYQDVNDKLKNWVWVNWITIEENSASYHTYWNSSHTVNCAHWIAISWITIPSASNWYYLERLNTHSCTFHIGSNSSNIVYCYCLVTN